MSDPFPPPGMALTHLLVVSDTRASARWYTDVLGAEPYREYGTSAVVAIGESWLLLVEEGAPTPDKPEVSFVLPDASRVSHSFTLRVPDCEAAYETLKSRGAAFLTPPFDRGGEIRCFLPDLDGHLWEISELVDRP